MATEAEELDGIEGEERAAAPACGRMKLIIIGVAALVLLGGGGFAGWKMMSGKPDAKSPAKKEEVEKLPPRYINLDPPFVVNFEAESMVRFLQVTVGVMTRDPAMEIIVKENDPRVRNDLLMILSNQTNATVSTLEGKEARRTRCLESVRGIVKEMGGDPKKIEALYFTSFVMQ